MCVCVCVCVCVCLYIYIYIYAEADHPLRCWPNAKQNIMNFEESMVLHVTWAKKLLANNNDSIHRRQTFLELSRKKENTILLNEIKPSLNKDNTTCWHSLVKASLAWPSYFFYRSLSFSVSALQG